MTRPGSSCSAKIGHHVYSDVLDIPTVFPRVSEVAKKMLPHDALAMVFVDRGNHFVREAASPPDFPDPPFVTAKT
jgi:hypothetical protein